MRFVADESCDAAIARALRAAGHDVTAVAERIPRVDDTAVIDLVVRESRMLLTEDEDFGYLVYGGGAFHSGVILLRYPLPARAAIARALVELLAQRGEQLARCFIRNRHWLCRTGRRHPADNDQPGSH